MRHDRLKERVPHGVERIARWVAHTSPALHSIVQPLWRELKRWLPMDDPSDARRSWKYYEEVVKLAQAYVPYGGQVIDVGAGVAEMLQRLSWFQRRVALDQSYAPRHRGIETLLVDFLAYVPDTTFDLVLCLEVLEHRDAPAAFAQKLLRIGHTTIISVPYKWPKGRCASHVQDPVDEARLAQWTQRQPTETRIVSDNNSERLIAVYCRPGSPT